MGFLIDTCVWIDLERGALSPADIDAITGDEPIFSSPITIAELRFGVEVSRDPGIRQKRSATLARLARKPILEIDGVSGDVFGNLAAALQKVGRDHQYRIQDLWLASQAIQHGYRFLTRNRKDFEDIMGLQLVVI